MKTLLIFFVIVFSTTLLAKDRIINNQAACLAFKSDQNKSFLKIVPVEVVSESSLQVSVKIKPGYKTKNCPGGTYSLFFTLSTDKDGISGAKHIVKKELVTRAVCLHEQVDEMYKANICYHVKPADFINCSNGDGTAIGFVYPSKISPPIDRSLFTSYLNICRPS